MALQLQKLRVKQVMDKVYRMQNSTNQSFSMKKKYECMDHVSGFRDFVEFIVLQDYI